jgi:pseudouridine synthase
LFPIGRMDFTGEGAMILTNDGEITQKIQKSNAIIRRYQVKLHRVPTTEELARIARGGRIENRSMTPYHVRLVETYAKNALVEISFEGMGALDVKQYFENKGFIPEKIARVGIGHISAEKLKPGDYKRLEGSSVEALLAQPELAKRQIARLVGTKTTGEVKVVSDTTLKADAEKKRRGRKGLFVESNVDAANGTSRGASERKGFSRMMGPGERGTGGRGAGGRGTGAARSGASERGPRREDRAASPESRGTRKPVAVRFKRK